MSDVDRKQITQCVIVFHPFNALQVIERVRFPNMRERKPSKLTSVQKI